MSDTVYVDRLPSCQMLKHREDTPVEAQYDARTTSGSWAYLCQPCFTEVGTGLGTGHGQRLVVGEEPERTDADIRADVAAAIESGDYEALEDALGDRDFAEFI